MPLVSTPIACATCASFVGGVVDVEAHHLRQDDAAGHAVRNVVQRSDRVRHGVRQADLGDGERPAGGSGGDLHVQPRLLVAAVLRDD